MITRIFLFLLMGALALTPAVASASDHETVPTPPLSSGGNESSALSEKILNSVRLSQGRVEVVALTWAGLQFVSGNGLLIDERTVLVPINLIPFYPELAHGKTTLYSFNGVGARLVYADAQKGLVVLGLSSAVSGMKPAAIAESLEPKEYHGAALLDSQGGSSFPMRMVVTLKGEVLLFPQNLPGGIISGTPFWNEEGKVIGILSAESYTDISLIRFNAIREFLGKFRQWLKDRFPDGTGWGDPGASTTDNYLLDLSVEDKRVISEQGRVFVEIMGIYAAKSLLKPGNLLACAQEMLRMKPNEKSCRDKHSVYVSKDKVEIESVPERTGQFGGVGIEIGARDDKVVVVVPIEGASAHRAGILAGDEIVKVDGAPVSDTGDAVRKIRGRIGTKVTVTVKRGGVEKTFDLVRETIVIHGVEAKVVRQGIGHLRVKTFSEVTPGEFSAAMEKFRREGVMKVVLDFRNNPGGLLHIASKVLYGFARPNDILIVMKERATETVLDAKYVKEFFREVFKKDLGDPGKFSDFKVVVLINKGSASASEIFAGAMKDWGYPVVGTASFGKGVGQTVFPLSDKSELRLTTFEFFVGNGRAKVDDIGVTPTHFVPDPVSSASEILREDKQIEKAVEILSRD